MRLCWENGADICFFTDWGRLEARVEGVPRGSVLLRRSQHAAAADTARSAALARAFVAGKLQNTRWLLSRSARDSSEATEADALRTVAEAHAHLLRELSRSPDDLDIIRGLEGRAAALHFECFPCHLKAAPRKSLPFTGRNRRPPRDPINCLLSFLYALLRHDCVSALTASGLDPFVGYLHAHRAGRESLALDLMEEFRPWVERLAITLINRGEFKPNHYVTRDGGGVELTADGRKALVATYQQRKQTAIQHPLFQAQVTQAQLPFIQARLLARAIRSETDYEPMLFS